MSEAWFKTSNYHPHITKVAVEKFTDSSVWVDGRRRSRTTEFEGYFPTFGDAKAHLLEKAEGKLANARSALRRAQGEHGNIAGLREFANATQQRNATGGEGVSGVEEAVAEVGATWSLLYIGGDSIADIARRQALKVGDKLYSQATVYTLRAQLEAAERAAQALANTLTNVSARAEAAEANAAAPAPVAAPQRDPSTRRPEWTGMGWKPAPASDAVADLPDEWRRTAEHLRSDDASLTYADPYDYCANALESALAQDRASQAGAAGVPEGWRLVPVEPTREMLDAYVSVSQPFHSARDDWAAMLAAAPAPAAEGEVRNVG